MALELKVPSIACSGCIDTITKAVIELDSSASVKGDVQGKSVSVETTASEDAVKEAIVKTGHTVE
jgi:copper chaperone